MSKETTSTKLDADMLGPSGVRGELHILAITDGETRSDMERLRDTSPRSFNVSGLLSKVPADTESIQAGFGPEDGGSYLLLPEAAAIGRVRCPDGVFEIKKNKSGEKSLIEFECVALSATEARRKFQGVVLPFLDFLSYRANCPIVVAAIRVEDSKNQLVTVDFVGPYRKTTGYLHETPLFLEMAPVYAMYREAKNSHSDFYRFLCYYKLLEGLLGKLRADVFQRARAKNLMLERPKDLVPRDEAISAKFVADVGQPVRKFFDDVLTPRFRNAVAHFVTDDGAILNMSAPEHIESYADILYIAELCVRVVMESHNRLLAQFPA